MLRSALFLIFAISLYAAANPQAEAARAKFTSIKKDKAAPGSTIVLTSEELNAWARAELAEEPALGIREPKIGLGPGSIHVDALVDFGKLAGGKKNQDGLLAWRLGGGRRIKLALRAEAQSGKVTVHLDLVQIAGLNLSGKVLNAAAGLLLTALSKEIVIDQPFKLGHSIDSATVSPEGVRVNIAGKRALPAPVKLPAPINPNQNPNPKK